MNTDLCPDILALIGLVFTLAGAVCAATYLFRTDSEAVDETRPRFGHNTLADQAASKRGKTAIRHNRMLQAGFWLIAGGTSLQILAVILSLIETTQA